jgi:hypothetical protein
MFSSASCRQTRRMPVAVPRTVFNWETMLDQPDQTVHSRDSVTDPEAEEHSTGLPGFRTWHGVYYFVLVVFVACVVLLKAFELVFS